MELIHLSDNDEQAVLAIYEPCDFGESSSYENNAVKKTAIVIFPGGGYQAHTEWECDHVAQYFAGQGFVPFVVKYSISPSSSSCYPELLVQASRAVWYVRSHSEKFGIDSEHIVGCGFSAGAHLTTMLATHWYENYCTQTTEIPLGGNKLNATVTGYTPTTFEDFKDRSGFDIDSKDGPGHLLTQGSDFSYLSSLTTHTRVDERTPPAFLWKTTADFPPGTFEYAMALEKAHIPYEVHVFDDSERCASAAAWDETKFAHNTQQWARLAIAWINRLMSNEA